MEGQKFVEFVYGSEVIATRPEQVGSALEQLESEVNNQEIISTEESNRLTKLIEKLAREFELIEQRTTVTDDMRETTFSGYQERLKNLMLTVESKTTRT